MNLDTKIPRLPQGLIALARASHLPDASTSPGSEVRTTGEPEEPTRAWKPGRALLQPEPQPASASDFALVDDEQTVVGATNLRDPCLFRSEPPVAPEQAAKPEWAADDVTTVEFVGSLTGLDRGEAQPAMGSAWLEEKTTLYKPQRSHLPPEEPTGEFEAAAAPQDAVVGAELAKVIIAPAVLAGSAPDPARAEATKRRRRRPGADTKLGLALCLLGGVALALSAAWRHPRTAPLIQDAFAGVVAAVSSLQGK